MSESFGRRFGYARKKRRYSQQAIADEMGVTRQAVSRWETGLALPNAHQITKFCDITGITADWLLGRTDFGGPDSTQEVIARAASEGPKVMEEGFIQRWQEEMEELIRRMKEDYEQGG